MNKYIKPKSLTFWAGATPLVAGVVVALSSVFPALEPAKTVIDAVSGGQTSGVLINAGLVAIGLRAAVK